VLLAAAMALGCC